MSGDHGGQHYPQPMRSGSQLCRTGLPTYITRNVQDVILCMSACTMTLKEFCPNSRLRGFKGMIFCRRCRHCWLVMVLFTLVRPVRWWLLHTARLSYWYIFQDRVTYPRPCVDFLGLITSYSLCLQYMEMGIG